MSSPNTCMDCGPILNQIRRRQEFTAVSIDVYALRTQFAYAYAELIECVFINLVNAIAGDSYFVPSALVQG